MMSRFRQSFLLCAIFLLGTVGSTAQKAFDTHANAQQDFETAKRVAKLQHKQIFLDFGANWCPGCIEIDHIIQNDVDLKEMMESFVVVHANVGGLFSRDKHTDAVRALYPPFRPIPQIMILDEDGKLLRQTDGDALTSDPKHNIFSKAKLVAFLNGPAQVPAADGRAE